jgi:hypothetical protein
MRRLQESRLQSLATGGSRTLHSHGLLRLRLLFLDVQKDLRGDPGGNPANFRASSPAVAAHLVKGRPFFRDDQTIDPTKPFLMDLRAKRVADFFIEPVIDATGFFHRFSVLILIFKPFPSNDGTNRHDRSGKRSTCLSPSCHTPGESASRFKNLRAAHM